MKIVSSMLLAMIIYILLKDAMRIVKFFVLNQATAPAVLSARRFKKRWKNVTLAVCKYILIAYAVLYSGYGAYQGMAQYGDSVKHPVLYGIFDTQKFILNKDTLPPLTTDSLRWRRFMITAYGALKVTFMNDSTRYYTYKNNDKAKTITLSKYQDTTHRWILNYTLSKDSVLHIIGAGPKGQLDATLKRYDEKKFPLMRRGFHWVNEVPFNR